MRCWGWGTKDPDLVIRGRSEHTQEAYTRRRHETEFYARQASILLGNNACRSGNDRSPTLKVFFALSRGRRGTQRALNSVSCLLLSTIISGSNWRHLNGPATEGARTISAQLIKA